MPLKKNSAFQFWGVTFIFAGSIVYLWFKCKDILETDPVTGYWLLGISALLFLALWFFEAKNSLARLYWTDDTVEIKMLGFTLRKHQRTELQMLCTAVYFGTSSSHVKDMIGLCFFSIEEAAARREKQIAAYPASREDLVWQKRKPDWQNILAQEYLHKKLNPRPLPLSAAIQKDIIWIDRTEETLKEMKQAFPNIPWLDVPRDTGCRC